MLACPFGMFALIVAPNLQTTTSQIYNFTLDAAVKPRHNRRIDCPLAVCADGKIRQKI